MIVLRNPKNPMKKPVQIFALAVFSLTFALPLTAQAVERKPPLHIKVKKSAPAKTSSGTSCPLIISGKSLASKYGIKVNLIRQDRKAVHLATALRGYFLKKGRDTQFISALYDASVQTGTDFELLVLKAMMESNLGQLNFAETSSARGTFQYIESTWLNLIHKYGKKAGYPDYAEAVKLNDSGTPYFEADDERLKPEILALRFDPYVSALIKSYQIAEESGEIKKFLKNRNISITDHYVVHMLGLNLAEKLYNLKNGRSKKKLADPDNPVFLAAAENNRVFFYDEDGQALDAAQVFGQFEDRVMAARLRLAKITAHYGVANGCGRFEPVPPYNAKTESEAALEEKQKELTFAFLLEPRNEEPLNQSTPQETEKICRQEPEIALISLPETAAGETTGEVTGEEIAQATPPPSAP